jgi:hypothetical protein
MLIFKKYARLNSNILLSLSFVVLSNMSVWYPESAVGTSYRTFLYPDSSVAIYTKNISQARCLHPTTTIHTTYQHFILATQIRISMSISVNILDNSLPAWQSANDVFRPILTAFSPATVIDLEYQTIHHIDVVQTWKGISVQQAEELLFWEDGFRQALQTVVEDYILHKSEVAGITFHQVISSKNPMS